MAIAAYFHPKNMTLQQFEKTLSLLEKAGLANPPGRIHHSCIGEDGDLMVYDIWESQEAFEAFGKALMPIVNQVGIDVGHPAVMQVHQLEQVAAS